jgi:hypothetical protein
MNLWLYMLGETGVSLRELVGSMRWSFAFVSRKITKLDLQRRVCAGQAVGPQGIEP